jgi:hypothetical protein
MLAAAAGRAMIDENAEPLVQFEARLGDNLTAAIFLSDGEVMERIGRVSTLEPDVETLCGLATGAASLVVYDVQEDQLSGVAFVGKDALIFAVKSDDIGKLITQFDRSAGF